MLVFPRERSLLRRRAVLIAQYALRSCSRPGVIGATVLKGGQSGGPASITTQLSLVWCSVIFSLALVAIVHGYVTATRTARWAWGLNLLVVCLVLGLAPIIPTTISNESRPAQRYRESVAL